MTAHRVYVAYSSMKTNYIITWKLLTTFRVFFDTKNKSGSKSFCCLFFTTIFFPKLINYKINRSRPQLSHRPICFSTARRGLVMIIIISEHVKIRKHSYMECEMNTHIIWLNHFGSIFNLKFIDLIYVWLHAMSEENTFLSLFYMISLTSSHCEADDCVELNLMSSFMDRSCYDCFII